MFRSSKRFRYLARCAAVAIAILVIGGSALWGMSAWRYNHVIDGWIATQREAGYDVQFENRRLGGFPWHVLVLVDNLRWKNNTAILFHADHMALKAGVWQSSIFDAQFKGRAELNAPVSGDGHALVLIGENGVAHIELDPQGFWRLCRVSLDAAQLGSAPNYIYTASHLKASALRPETPATDHSQTGLTVTAEAQDVVLPAAMPAPFGERAEEFAVNLRVMGAMPDFRRHDAVDAWNKDSGVVEFDNLQMRWGALELTAKGTLGFDDALQPEGAFSAAIGNQSEVLRILSDKGLVPQRQEAMLQSALTMFSAKDYNKVSNQAPMEMPITIQLGGLFIGPIKIFTFPEIRWEGVALPATPAQ